MRVLVRLKFRDRVHLINEKGEIHKLTLAQARGLHPAIFHGMTGTLYHDARGRTKIKMDFTEGDVLHSQKNGDTMLLLTYEGHDNAETGNDSTNL